MNALYGPNFPEHGIANEALFSERRWEKYESARMKEACQESSVLPLLPLINGIASLRHMFRLEELALTLKRLVFFSFYPPFFFFFCFVNCLLLLSFKSLEMLSLLHLSWVIKQTGRGDCLGDSLREKKTGELTAKI